MNYGGHTASNPFSTRFFNHIEKRDGIIIKSSTNKGKIFAEYNYYQLLPDVMKKYMVEPFDYFDYGTEAGYSMKQINCVDFAKKWVQKEVGLDEFKKFLDALFEYLSNRPQKQIEKTAFKERAEGLYVDKVRYRIEKYLKIIEKDDNFAEVRPLIRQCDLKGIFKKYLSLFERLHKNEEKSVISHGDLCFSNIFFQKEADQKLLLIDPRGANTEAELWTNPYYDVAKISHSIMGNYDFFNAGLYTISSTLELEFNTGDLAPYQKMFIEYLERYGYDYRLIRLYEASLFLSMLPLHIDDPRKTLGFILNANRVLIDLENVR